MNDNEAFEGLQCLECSTDIDTNVGTVCPECAGPLVAQYDHTILATAHEELFSDEQLFSAVTTRESPVRGPGLGRFSPVLPFDASDLPTLSEGSTPLVSCPSLSTDGGPGEVLLKAEGQNPTGGAVDRQMAVALAGANAAAADTVALPTTGNGGQSAAAYAARAGLSSQAFAPSRSTFDTKAMINVHGGEMSVVGGRYQDAAKTFESERADEWFSLAPFETPYRHEGAKTLAYELTASLGSSLDAVVLPVGHGITLFGLYRGFDELVRTATLDSFPRLYVAQPDGCAPIVTAWKNDTTIEPVEYPDTICGSLEIPDPAGGEYVLEALEATDGDGVAPTDHDALDSALELAGTGVPISATGGVAIAGFQQLQDEGTFDSDETVVVVDPVTANRETDLLRSRLMSKGV